MNLKSFSCTCLLTCLLSLGALAQSTFQLLNLHPAYGIDAPVFDAQGIRLSGTNYAVELWGGISSESLSPALILVSGQHIGPRNILPFGTGTAAGYFGSSEAMAVLSAAPGGYAWLQVRAWDARLGPTYEDVQSLGQGGYGESQTFYAMGGDPIGYPPTLPRPLIGLQSFSLRKVVPEPSTWTLLALGGAAFCWLSRRRRFQP